MIGSEVKCVIFSSIVLNSASFVEAAVEDTGTWGWLQPFLGPYCTGNCSLPALKGTSLTVFQR